MTGLGLLGLAFAALCVVHAQDYSCRKSMRLPRNRQPQLPTTGLWTAGQAFGSRTSMQGSAHLCGRMRAPISKF